MFSVETLCSGFPCTICTCRNDTCCHIATNISLLSGAQHSIDNAVYLHLDTTVELDKLKTAEGCITNARSAEVVAALEELVTQWCQQIEQVYVCVCVCVCVWWVCCMGLSGLL